MMMMKQDDKVNYENEQLWKSSRNNLLETRTQLKPVQWKDSPFICVRFITFSYVDTEDRQYTNHPLGFLVDMPDVIVVPLECRHRVVHGLQSIHAVLQKILVNLHLSRQHRSLRLVEIHSGAADYILAHVSMLRYLLTHSFKWNQNSRNAHNELEI